MAHLTAGSSELNFANNLRHVRKTVAFSGAAGNGQVGTVDVFTVTGVVWANRLTAVCTENLVSAGGGTLVLGTAGDTDGFIAQTTATDIANADIWTAASPAAGSKGPLKVETGGLITGQVDKVVNESIALTVGTGDVTDGTIVFDLWWHPVTDSGAVVAA